MGGAGQVEETVEQVVVPGHVWAASEPILRARGGFGRAHLKEPRSFADIEDTLAPGGRGNRCTGGMPS